MFEHKVVNAAVCAALLAMALAWIVSLAKAPIDDTAYAGSKSFVGAPPLGVTVCKPSAPARSFRVAPLEDGQHPDSTYTFIVVCADGTKQILSVQQRVLLNVDAKAMQK